MSKNQEFHFSYKAMVLVLKQFHLRKKRKLEEEIKERYFSDERIPKAQQYVKIIESALNSEYFAGEMLNCTVGDLMKWLKDDDVIFAAKIEELRKKLELMKKKLQNFEDSIASEEFLIPDENKDYNMSIAERKRKYLWETEAIQDELKDYEYRLRLCRNIKGMIQRPNGFYNAVYNAK